MTPLLLAVALLAVPLAGGPPRARPKPKAHPHYWKDSGGRIHITDAPPPPGAELIEMPRGPATGREAPAPATAPPPDPLEGLSPAARPRWEALRSALRQARQ